jgi:signal transduction histidine kinase
MPLAVQTEKFTLNVSSIPGLERKFVNTDYFANVCHEIRTPLNAITGLATILASPDVTPKKQRECARMLQDSSHMLAELLNDLLDSFKLENERMDLEHIPFDLTKVLEEATNIITVRAKEKGLGIYMRIGRGIPALYVGDPLRIRQIVLNLLSNAVKFTSEGIISVHMAEENRADGHAEVSITVADCGIGIDHEKLGKIFDKYTQGDASVSRKYGGTGLGLFISQELAHLMKGSITVKSWPHMGSHFTLTLPLQRETVSVVAT